MVFWIWLSPIWQIANPTESHFGLFKTQGQQCCLFQFRSILSPLQISVWELAFFSCFFYFLALFLALFFPSKQDKKRKVCKIMQKQDYNEQKRCIASVCWSKYTTHKCFNVYMKYYKYCFIELPLDLHPLFYKKFYLIQILSIMTSKFWCN